MMILFFYEIGLTVLGDSLLTEKDWQVRRRVPYEKSTKLKKKLLGQSKSEDERWEEKKNGRVGGHRPHGEERK